MIITRRFLVPMALMLVALAGCSGDDGKDGAPGETTVIGVVPASSAKSADVKIEGVEINSAPVVTFSATDGGSPVTGLTTGNLRFNIAKLVPGSMGDPSSWQDYINRLEGTSLQGTTENDGTLEELGGGKYRYTFATDITIPSETVGSISYQPSLTHRVAMQISGFPANNPTFDFRPDGGAIALRRDIVQTETCNSCHNKLAIHGGGRVEVKYCVTCHNPGSTDDNSGNSVDFATMVHKIHRGEDLPSVAFGPDLIDGTGDDGTGVYQIVGFRNSVHDYSNVVFPQDIRNCTTCHTATAATPQGNNWKTHVSTQACGTCHDNIDFSKDGSDAGANDPVGHSGGIVTDNTECTTCHASGRIAGSVEDRHTNPVKAYEPRFQFNLLSVCGTDVDMNPDCSGAPVTPTVTFSVSDPTGGTHGYGTMYNLNTDPEFGASASLNILTSWDSSDYTNVDGDGSRPSRANSFSLSNIKAMAVDNLDGTYTATLDALPGSITSGSAGVAMEGHPRGESEPGSGNFDTSIPVRGQTAYFGINGSPRVARRVAVDIAGKCDKCHDKLSLHGNNRADNAQLCVMCHNPRGTDIGRRDTVTNGVPEISPFDGKREETVDMKVLIHAIHAGERDNPATATVEGHGMREEGIVVYGFGNSEHDYGHVRYPGILSDCTACHNTGTYELDGTWAAPLQNGILATTVASAPDASTLTEPAFTAQMADQSDDLFTTPTAAVCSACHDSQLAQAHMKGIGGALFAEDQAAIAASYETCSVCHGPDAISDINVAHGID